MAKVQDSNLIIQDDQFIYFNDGTISGTGDIYAGNLYAGAITTITGLSSAPSTYLYYADANGNPTSTVNMRYLSDGSFDVGDYFGSGGSENYITMSPTAGADWVGMGLADDNTYIYMAGSTGDLDINAEEPDADIFMRADGKITIDAQTDSIVFNATGQTRMKMLGNIINFFTNTISGIGDIYCNDLYTAGSSVHIGDNVQLSETAQNGLYVQAGARFEISADNDKGNIYYDGQYLYFGDDTENNSLWWEPGNKNFSLYVDSEEILYVHDSAGKKVVELAAKGLFGPLTELKLTEDTSMTVTVTGTEVLSVTDTLQTLGDTANTSFTLDSANNYFSLLSNSNEKTAYLDADYLLFGLNDASDMGLYWDVNTTAFDLIADNGKSVMYANSAGTSLSYWNSRVHLNETYMRATVSGHEMLRLEHKFVRIGRTPYTSMEIDEAGSVTFHVTEGGIPGEDEFFITTSGVEVRQDITFTTSGTSNIGTAAIPAGDIYCNDLYAAGSSVHIGNEQISSPLGAFDFGDANLQSIRHMAVGNDADIDFPGFPTYEILCNMQENFDASIIGAYGLQLYARGAADSASAAVRGIIANAMHTGSGQFNELRGVYGAAYTNTAGATGTTIRGIYGSAYMGESNSTVTNLIGGYFTAGAVSSMVTATGTNVVAGQFRALAGGSGDFNVENTYGVQILTPGATYNGTLTNLYGLYIEDMTASSISFANEYNIYSAGATSKNYFAGDVVVSGTIYSEDILFGANTVSGTGDIYAGNFYGNGVEITSSRNDYILFPQEVNNYNPAGDLYGLEASSWAGGSPIIYDSDDGSRTVFTALRNGGFMVGYRDSAIGGGEEARISAFSADGSPTVTGTVIASDVEQVIALGTLTNGNVVVSYKDQADGNKGKFMIVDERTNTVKAATEFTATMTTYAAHATPLSNGGFMLIYAPDNSSFQTIVYDEDGTQINKPPVVAMSIYGQYFDTAPTQDGGVIVAYVDDNDVEMIYVILNSLGVITHTEVVKTDCNDTPYCAVMNNGNYFISWYDDCDEGYPVYAIYDSNNNIVKSQAVMDTSNSTVKGVVPTSDGGVAVLYTKASLWNVKFYDSTGAVLETVTLTTHGTVITFTSFKSAAALNNGTIVVGTPNYDTDIGYFTLLEPATLTIDRDILFGANTISGTGDIYCGDLYTAGSSVHIGDNAVISETGSNKLNLDSDYFDIRADGKTMFSNRDGYLFFGYDWDSSDPWMGWETSTKNLSFSAASGQVFYASDSVAEIKSSGPYNRVRIEGSNDQIRIQPNVDGSVTFEFGNDHVVMTIDGDGMSFGSYTISGTGDIHCNDIYASGGGIDHNTLGGLQGGDSSEYYHLNVHEEAQISATSTTAITLGTAGGSRFLIDGNTEEGSVRGYAESGTLVFQLVESAQTLGVVNDSVIVVNQNSDTINFKSANNTQMTVTTDGLEMSNDILFGANTISGTGDIYCGNLYISGSFQSNDFNTPGLNVFVGATAGANTTTNGIRNTAVGNQALATNTDGDVNVAIGYRTMGFTGGGDFNYNTAVGGYAGYAITIGGNNVFLGATSGRSITTASGNVFLGYAAGRDETGSNKLYIENSESASPLIYGEFDNDLVVINGDLDITGNVTVSGTITPSNGWTGSIPTISGTIAVVDGIITNYS